MTQHLSVKDPHRGMLFPRTGSAVAPVTHTAGSASVYREVWESHLALAQLR